QIELDRRLRWLPEYQQRFVPGNSLAGIADNNFPGYPFSPGKDYNFNKVGSVRDGVQEIIHRPKNTRPVTSIIAPDDQGGIRYSGVAAVNGTEHFTRLNMGNKSSSAKSNTKNIKNIKPLGCCGVPRPKETTREYFTADLSGGAKHGPGYYGYPLPTPYATMGSATGYGYGFIPEVIPTPFTAHPVGGDPCKPKSKCNPSLDGGCAIHC